jgi:peptidoglycan/LPS O-acetylase OafA/YrhL
MIFHLQPYLPESFEVIGRYGWIGVDLFFVMSGYLIGGQLLKSYATGARPSLSSFYRRRAFRILPAYLVVLTLYFTIPIWREQPGISPVWMFLTFTQNLLIHIETNRAFSQAWSLCVEEHFYLVLPLLFIAMMRKPSLRKTVAFLATIIALGIAWRTYVLFHQLVNVDVDTVSVPYLERIYYPTYSHLDGLVAGVSLAMVRAFRPDWWEALAHRGHLLLIVSLLPLGAALWMFQDGQGAVTGPGAWGVCVGFPVLSLGLVLLVASSISRNGLLSRVRIPGAKLIALLAYSLYLTHKEIAHLDRVFLPALTARLDWKTTVLYALSCTAGAGILYLCVERPGMLLRERLDKAPTDRVNQQALTEPAL